MKKNKGFTLIELLVVIAIIGILSSVVLASLNSARQKGQDAAIKQNLNNMRAQSEMYFDDDLTYGPRPDDTSASDVCTSSDGLKEGYDKAVSISGENNGNCLVSNEGDSWVAWVKLKSDSTTAWCIDSEGLAEEVPWSNTTSGISSCSDLRDTQ